MHQIVHELWGLSVRCPRLSVRCTKSILRRIRSPVRCRGSSVRFNRSSLWGALSQWDVSDHPFGGIEKCSSYCIHQIPFSTILPPVILCNLRGQVENEDRTEFASSEFYKNASQNLADFSKILQNFNSPTTFLRNCQNIFIFAKIFTKLSMLFPF